nr:MAG: internal scaffolding protein [Microvirus sp.]
MATPKSKYEFIEPHSMRIRHQVEFDEWSDVNQEYAIECDITTILNRYQRTGELPPGHHEPVYQDVADLCGQDFAGIRELVMTAQEAVDSAKKAEDLLKAEIERMQHEPQTPTQPSTEVPKTSP